MRAKRRKFLMRIVRGELKFKGFPKARAAKYILGESQHKKKLMKQTRAISLARTSLD